MAGAGLMVVLVVLGVAGLVVLVVLVAVLVVEAGRVWVGDAVAGEEPTWINCPP
ncbi:MAG TPA: hypothetical protein VMW83_06100 [Spirochaetia bacterium]|nr:hypothetical protein [Spirochaetia bacterium]